MELSQRNLARIIGISLFVMAVITGVGYCYAFSGFYIANDTISTIKNLNQDGNLLKLTIFAFSINLILNIVITWASYEFFKSFNNPFSSLVALFRLVYSAILCGSIFYLLSVLELLQNASTDGEMIMFYLKLFLKTGSWGLIIFGCHLFLLGIIISRSGFVPKFIGFTTSFAGLCYFFAHSCNLLVSSYIIYKEMIESILALPMALGELVLAIWLIRFKSRNQEISH